MPQEQAVPFASREEIEAALPRIVAHLRGTKPVACATDTVYGFSSLVEPSAAQRVAALKGAGADRAFIVLVAGQAMLAGLDITMTDAAHRLADAFWPGPLTLVVSGKAGTVAVRWPSIGAALHIISALGAPITSTSANRTGLSPARTAEEIVREWDAEVRAGELVVLDSGALVADVPSTIVDCTTVPPRLKRPGALDPRRVLQVVPTLAGVV